MKKSHYVFLLLVTGIPMSSLFGIFHYLIYGNVMLSVVVSILSWSVWTGFIFRELRKEAEKI